MLNTKSLWWEQIANARHLIDDIVNFVLHQESVLLTIPERVPWRGEFNDMIQQELLEEGRPDNKLDIIEGCPSANPGEYLLENYCKHEKRLQYRHGISHAEFLAQSSDIVLNNRYIWLTDVPAGKVDEWVNFINEYNNFMPASRSPACFILEVHSNDLRQKAKKHVKYVNGFLSFNPYDFYTFAALTSQNVQCENMLRPYLVELASNISLALKDVELCEVLARAGTEFIKNPEKILRDAGKYALTSSDINRLVWQSQLKILFPKIEYYRADFIKKHYDALDSQLPITNDFTGIIDRPEALEIGTLFHIAVKKQIALTQRESDTLSTFKAARDALAHSRGIDFNMLCDILYS